MLRPGCLATLCVGAFAAPALAASPPAPAPSMELMQAAVVVLTYDRLAAECGRALPPDTAQWERTNRVDRVRVRLAELMSDPARRAVLERASNGVVDAVHAKSADACRAATAVTHTREAQFGALVPELRSEPAAEPRSPVSAPAASVASGPSARGPAASNAASAAPSRVAEATLAQIEGFAFDTRAGIGFGGMVTIDVYPVVVFRDGRLLTDVTGLAHSAGIDAHRREHPEDWTRWRRAGGELQREGAKGWEKLAFQKLYSRLPAGFRLDGTFRRLGGAGTLGVGGTDAVAVWSEYTFTPDGRVVRGGGAGARSEAGDVSTVTRGTAPGRTGRYRVDGLRLRIDYDDGTSEAPVLVADPEDPKGAIWLDGAGYAQRRK